MSNENHNDGKIPDLNQKADEVLGIPKGTVKNKSNVSKLFLMVGFIAALTFLFIAVLAYFKNQTTRKIEKEKNELINKALIKNEAVNNDSLEKLQADILKQQQAESERKKAAEEAEAARLAALKAQQQKQVEQKQSVNVAVQHTQQPQKPAQPPPPTRQELMLSGSVLLVNENTTGKDKAFFSEYPETDKKQPIKAQVPDAPNYANALTPPEKPDRQAQANTELNNRLTPSVLTTRSASKLGNLDFLLKKGTTIPCALKTGINSTLPGFVTCTVTNDIYSANGKILLVERGSSIFGEQRSSLMHGQARVFVLWNRIDNPTGITVNIDSPAADQQGYSGIHGFVDTHFWERFGGAIMLSFINDALAAAVASQSKNGNQNQIQNSTNATQNMAADALKNTINIPPTITVLPGKLVTVMVARDVSFEQIYSLAQYK